MSDSSDLKAYIDNKSGESQAIPVDDTQIRNLDLQDYINRKENTNYDTLQSQYGGLENQAAAFGLGAMRGASLGTSDLGIKDKEYAKGVAAANPGSSGVGQFLGSIAPIAATGGLAGAAGPVLGTAIQGGILGAGDAMSDYALGDPNLNAQKIMAHVGTGILVGAVLGKLGKVVEASLPSAARKLGSAIDSVKELAVGTDAAPGILEKVAPDWVKNVKLGMDNAGIKPDQQVRKMSSNLGDIYTSLKKATAEMYDTAGNKINDSLESMPVIQAKQNMEGTLQNLQSIAGGNTAENPAVGALSSPKSAKLVSGFLDDLSDSIDSAKNASDVHEIARTAATKLDKIIPFDTIPTAANIADKNILTQLRESLRGDLKNPELWGDAAPHYQTASDLYFEHIPNVENFQKGLMKRIIGPSGTKTWVMDGGKVQSMFNSMGDITQANKENFVNKLLDSGSRIAKESENFAGFEKGSNSISDHIESLAKQHGEMAELAQAMKSTGGDPTLGIAGGLKVLGAPNSVVAAAGMMAKMSRAITNPYELGSTLGNSFNKLKSLGELLAKSTSSIENGTKSIFAGNAEREVTSNMAAPMSEGLFNKTVKRVNELMSNPEALQNHLATNTDALYEVAPNITSGIHTAMLSGLNFLNSKLPKPNQTFPMSGDWKASNSQRAQFGRYYTAVNDPMSIIKDIKKGTLSNEAMMAISAVHPALLKQIQQEVMGNMNPKKIQKLNYGVKTSISKLLQMPLEAALQPTSILANQAAFALPSQMNRMQGSRAKSGGGSAKGMRGLGMSRRSATTTQQLDNNEE